MCCKGFQWKWYQLFLILYLFPASNTWLAGLAPAIPAALSAVSRSFRRSKPLKASADKAGWSASWRETALRVSPSIVSCHVRFLKESNPTSDIIRSTKINWKTTMGLKFFLAFSDFLLYLFLLTLAFFTDINIELFSVIVLVAPSSVKWKGLKDFHDVFFAMCYPCMWRAHLMCVSFLASQAFFAPLIRCLGLGAQLIMGHGMNDRVDVLSIPPVLKMWRKGIYI